MFQALEEIARDRKRHVQTAIEQERNSLRNAIEQARESDQHPAFSADDVARIEKLIDDGDLTTAAEYIVTVSAGSELVSPGGGIDHLTRFTAALPTLFAQDRPRRGPHPLLGELVTLLNNGRNPDDGPFAEALAAAGIDLAAVDRTARAATVASRVEQWRRLAIDQTLGGKSNNVKAVLEQIGFIVDRTATKRSLGTRAAWLDLNGVRATAGDAPIPAFGSAMGSSLRLLAVWQSPNPGELIQMISEEPADRSLVVLYFGTLAMDARRELARRFRVGSRLPPTAVVDDAAFAYLACQSEPGRNVTMAITLPFTSAWPFTPDVAGLVPQEMFKGRVAETGKVTDPYGPCIVYGGRQLGKSALLQAATRDFDNGTTRRAVYKSIFRIGNATSADAVWAELWPELAEQGIIPRTHKPPLDGRVLAEKLCQHVERWVEGSPDRYLLLLLDESDEFLNADGDASGGTFTQVSRFKELMERTGRRVKVVFAGLHQTARFERQANHPLAHFGDPICVGPLAPQAGFDLLTKPLEALGYRFADSDVAARVLALTNSQPALIQLFGGHLLRNLANSPVPRDAPPQWVTRDDIELVWSDPKLRKAFRQRFDWTINLDSRYVVIAYVVAWHAHDYGIDTTLSAAKLRSECEQWWPAGFSSANVRADEFRGLLDECVDLGVLSRTKLGYRLRTPNVLDLIGSQDDVVRVLEQAESLEVAPVFDSGLVRPQFATSATRVPLTNAQIGDLLAPRNQVRVVAGSEALTVGRCVKTLADWATGTAAGMSVRSAVFKAATPTTLRTACAQTTMKAAGRHAVVAVDLRSATPRAALDAWDQARAIIAGGQPTTVQSAGTLGIVLVSGPEQAPAWPAVYRGSDTSSGLTELRRYGNPDLRMSLAETTLPFQDDASRADLLAVTGGWPLLVNQVADLWSRHQGLMSTDPLASVRTWLKDPAHAAELVTKSGVRADAALSTAWDVFVSSLAAYQQPLSEFASYLEMHAAEEADSPLAPAELKATGYEGGVEDVVLVLRDLGLLTPRQDDTFAVEQVMANATRIERMNRA